MSDLRTELLEGYQVGNFLETAYRISLGDPNSAESVALELAAMHNENLIDIVAAFDGLKNDGPNRPDFFLTRHLFERALPEISAPTSSVMRCVLQLYKEAGQDWAAGTIITSYIGFCERMDSRAHDALAEIEKDPDTLLDLLPATMTAGRRSDPSHFARAAIRLCDHDNLELKRQAVFCLGTFKDIDKVADSALCKLEAVVPLATDDRLLAAVILAAFSFFEADSCNEKRVAALIKIALTRGGEQSVHAASQVFGFQTSALTESLLDDFSVYLAGARPENTGTFRNIDFGLSTLISSSHFEKAISLIGGDVQEQVRPQLVGFMQQHTTGDVEFEEWNGDRLASLIESHFLREDLLPSNSRSLLRKSLALADEPDASFRHFSQLTKSLSAAATEKVSDQIRTLRQISICLWILFTWSRDTGNTESAYLSGELALLHAWNISKRYVLEQTKDAEAVASAFSSVFTAYLQICRHLVGELLPHVNKLHAISAAVQPSCGLDVNLKLFDLLGRLATAGLWAWWGAEHASEEAGDAGTMLNEANGYCWALKSLVANNPALLLPLTDDQSTDISIALLLLVRDKSSHSDILTWLGEIADRAEFAYKVNGRYPCTLRSYADLLLHPKKDDPDYMKAVTSGSVLYPLIAMYSALIEEDSASYKRVVHLKDAYLQHCTFQLWYPNQQSEEFLFTNGDLHGASLCDINLNQPGELLEQVFSECDRSPHFNDLSAVRYGCWPLVVVACRHYRLPLPIHLLKRWSDAQQTSAKSAKSATVE
jgi:hypothetical protein